MTRECVRCNTERAVMLGVVGRNGPYYVCASCALPPKSQAVTLAKKGSRGGK